MTYMSPSVGRLDQLTTWIKRKHDRLLKRARNRVRHSNVTSRAMFIVGAGRSGTDLMAAKLSESFDVALFNEDHPAAFANWRMRELAVLDGLVERVNAPVLLFKPIVETYRLPELLAHFPESKALFIARNPYDAIDSRIRFFGEATHREVQQWVETDFSVTRTWKLPPDVASEAKAMYGNGVSLEDAAGIYWFVYNSAHRALMLHQDPRVKVVLYEEVVMEPEREFRRACEHLGVGFRSSMVEGVFTSSVGHSTAPSLSHSVDSACLRLWRGLLDARGQSPFAAPAAALSGSSRGGRRLARADEHSPHGWLANEAV